MLYLLLSVDITQCRRMGICRVFIFFNLEFHPLPRKSMYHQQLSRSQPCTTVQVCHTSLFFLKKKRFCNEQHLLWVRKRRHQILCQRCKCVCVITDPSECSSPKEALKLKDSSSSRRTSSVNLTKVRTVEDEAMGSCQKYFSDRRACDSAFYSLSFAHSPSFYSRCLSSNYFYLFPSPSSLFSSFLHHPDHFPFLICVGR